MRFHPLLPYNSNLDTKLLCCTLLKASLRSIKNAMALCSISNISSKFPTNSPNALSVECFCQNLCCLVKNILLFSKSFLAFLSTFFS